MKNNRSECDPRTGCCDPDSKKNNIETQNTANFTPASECCAPQNTPYTKEPQRLPIQRRDFMRTMGAVLGGMAVGVPALGSTKRRIRPNDNFLDEKGLDPEWVKSLYERGEPEIFTGKELVYIGMPVGGIAAGQVYLGGDGKLWLWNIFNAQHSGAVEKTIRHDGRNVSARSGSNYVVPIDPASPFEQGFSLKVAWKGKEIEKELDYKGFRDMTFKGQYPMGQVAYRDGKLPVDIDLEAFSPFVPLDLEASSYPATVMRYTLRNTGDETVVCTLTGRLENAVHIATGDAVRTKIRNRFSQRNGDAVIALDAPVSLATNKNSMNDPGEQRDHGSMALLLKDVGDGDKFDLGDGQWAKIGSDAEVELVADLEKRYVGKLSKTIELAPGGEKAVAFVIGWYFPNLYPQEGRDYSDLFEGRSYKTRFGDAVSAVVDLAFQLDGLYQKTALWVKTFYEDSTLPHWFLNRTMANTSTLATETCYLLDDGRFWAWEGIGCCPGTCTHVWHYAQAMGRLFPELERNLRERTDFKVMDKSTGEIDFRAGLAGRDAADGHAGIIMRAYRDHQMSRSNGYIKRNWDNIKLAMGYLIAMDVEDGKADGMIFGEQHNTLDAEWYGNIPVITSLYLCALACGKEMAMEMGDNSFEKKCSDLLAIGQKNIEGLFNKEYGYFVQREDPNHMDAIGIGAGCYIDQVFGQGWAFQVGLGRLFNADMNRQALAALYKNNYIKDMGTYRSALPPSLAGRPFALDGESGLVMCTWPNGGLKRDWEKHWQYGYFNECMSGFEYQAAGHMIWEGGDLLQKGLAVTRSVHDRYHPSKRNPYNEVECSDHYARAMASYGVYIAACGFEYHGPKGLLSFDPRWQQENFKAAFVTAEGWGTFVQQRSENKQTATIALKYGLLKLKHLKLNLAGKSKKIKISHNKKHIKTTVERVGDVLNIHFGELMLNTKDVITIVMG